MNARTNRQLAHDNETPEDLYCPQCGYNLRGLTGDWLQCPECGDRHRRVALQIPARLITKQLRKMETAPALSVGCLIGIIMLGLIAIGMRKNGQTGGDRYLAIGAPVFVLLWFAAVRRFGKSCGAHEGWRLALATYHLYAFLAVFAVYVAPVLVAVFARNRFGTHPCFMYPAALLGGIASVRFIYRRATAPIEQVQRDVAVRITLQQTGRGVVEHSPQEGRDQ